MAIAFLKLARQELHTMSLPKLFSSPEYGVKKQFLIRRKYLTSLGGAIGKGGISNLISAIFTGQTPSSLQNCT